MAALTTGLLAAGGATYIVDMIVDMFRESSMGNKQLELQRLALEGQLQQAQTSAVRGRKEEVRTDRLIQQAMKMRRDEQNKNQMMQMLMMIEGFKQQKTNSLLNFVGNINAARQAPIGGY